MGKYSVFQIFYLIFYKVIGWFIFKNARLIRFPFRVRGKQYIKIGKGFTTGFNCRIDALNINNLGKKYLIEIGENVEINDEVHIGATEKIIIEDNVLIASKVYTFFSYQNRKECMDWRIVLYFTRRHYR